LFKRLGTGTEYYTKYIHNLRMFVVRDMPFQPSIMFVDKPRSLA
jgi:hypothetical protein